MAAAIIGAGHALPPPMSQQRLWDGFFRRHYADSAVARKAWSHAGIRTRRGVVDPVVEDISTWSTGARMRRFVLEAAPLGKEAVATALAAAGLSGGDVGLFAVVSCTGYATPGLDILLARDLAMPDTVRRLHIGHMGCYAALPGLGAVADFVEAHHQPAVLLCVELPSLHVQPATATARSGEPTPADIEQMVAHALFGDAAAAVVLAPGGRDTAPAGAYEVVDIAARTDVDTMDLMTWEVTDLGFKMGLSQRVPEVLGRHVRPAVTGLLARHGLAIVDVEAWAVHPGGRRIVEVVGEALGLSAAQLAPSYQVLSEVGNCSSATVLLVLEQAAAALSAGAPAGAPAGVPAGVPGGWLVALAFGPGLTLYTALLRRR